MADDRPTPRMDRGEVVGRVEAVAGQLERAAKELRMAIHEYHLRHPETDETDAHAIGT